MAYRELGQGRPIVFLHGNPTSSYLWRHVLPALTHRGRCLAPDLVGMGASDKLPDSGPGSYRFIEHRAYLDELLESLGIADDVVLVAHDWGGVLAMDWARRHPRAVAGIAYLETIVWPTTWQTAGAPDRELFEALRSDQGESLVLTTDVFLDAVLAHAFLEPLDDVDAAAYRAPYLEPGESRRPILTWTREVPIEGRPADVATIVRANARWMAQSSVPKLLVSAEPGAVLVGPALQRCRSWPNQVEATVTGAHFLPEDAPVELTAALELWLAGLS